MQGPEFDPWSGKYIPHATKTGTGKFNEIQECLKLKTSSNLVKAHFFLFHVKLSKSLDYFII